MIVYNTVKNLIQIYLPAVNLFAGSSYPLFIHLTITVNLTNRTLLLCGWQMRNVFYLRQQHHIDSNKYGTGNYRILNLNKIILELKLSSTYEYISMLDRKRYDTGRPFVTVTKLYSVHSWFTSIA